MSSILPKLMLQLQQQRLLITDRKNVCSQKLKKNDAEFSIDLERLKIFSITWRN
jgi:hypothetical protein